MARAGLEGQTVYVNAAGGNERLSTRGRVVSVGPELLVVEQGGQRFYINCAQVHSVVVAAPVGQRPQPGTLPGTIESIWKAFDD